MNSPHIRARATALGAMLMVGTWLAFLSCSSDPTNTLGSDSDLLGSEPGTVYQDTLGVFEDTTYVFDTPIADDTDLEIGRDANYQRTIVIQPGFAELDTFPKDRQRTVATASIHFFTGNLNGNFLVRFYSLGKKYIEGDAVSGLDQLTDADVIPDAGGALDRNLEVAEPNYSIAAATAQQWIREDSTRTGIVIVYTDTANLHIGTLPSSETTSGHPYLSVRFTDGVVRAYDVRNDATVFKPLATTSHLVASDGFARRVFLRAHIDSLAKDSAVHNARMRFHIVPGSILSSVNVDSLQAVDVILYIPDSTDPADATFKTGQRITPVTILEDQATVDFPLANAISLILQGKLKNNGFAIRCANENTNLRQVEFYGTEAADSLRPRVFVTSSTPAVFH